MEVQALHHSVICNYVRVFVRKTKPSVICVKNQPQSILLRQTYHNWLYTKHFLYSLESTPKMYVQINHLFCTNKTTRTDNSTIKPLNYLTNKKAYHYFTTHYVSFITKQLSGVYIFLWDEHSHVSEPRRLDGRASGVRQTSGVRHQVWTVRRPAHLVVTSEQWGYLIATASECYRTWIRRRKVLLNCFYFMSSIKMVVGVVFKLVSVYGVELCFTLISVYSFTVVCELMDAKIT